MSTRRPVVRGRASARPASGDHAQAGRNLSALNRAKRGTMELDSNTTTTPPAPTKPEPSLVRTRTLAVFTALAMAAGFGAGWFSHTSSSTASTGTGTTAVHGMLQLPDGGYTSVGNVCSGSGGYQDISAGVAVTIGDQTGKTLAVTSLQPGGFGGGGCQFTFSAKVAAATTYTVTVSHRGTQTFTPADIPGGFNMTLNAG